MTHFQIYTLLYRLNVSWPDLWTQINNPGSTLSFIISGFPSIDIYFLFPNDGRSTFLSQFIFSIFMSLPLLFWILYNIEYVQRFFSQSNKLSTFLQQLFVRVQFNVLERLSGIQSLHKLNIIFRRKKTC